MMPFASDTHSMVGAPRAISSKRSSLIWGELLIGIDDIRKSL